MEREETRKQGKGDREGREERNVLRRRSVEERKIGRGDRLEKRREMRRGIRRGMMRR